MRNLSDLHGRGTPTEGELDLGSLDLSWVWGIAREVSGFARAFWEFLRHAGRGDLVPDKANALAFEVEAEATVVGEQARAEVSVRGKVADHGGIDVVSGRVEARAEASSRSGDEPVAEVATHIDVEGADFVYSYTREAGTSRDRWGEMREGAAETVAFVAIDFDAFDLADGPFVVEKEGRGWWRDSRLDGVTAEAEAKAEAHGATAYATSETDTFGTDGFAVAAAFSGGAIA